MPAGPRLGGGAPSHRRRVRYPGWRGHTCPTPGDSTNAGRRRLPERALPGCQTAGCARIRARRRKKGKACHSSPCALAVKSRGGARQRSAERRCGPIAAGRPCAAADARPASFGWFRCPPAGTSEIPGSTASKQRQKWPRRGGYLSPRECPTQGSLPPERRGRGARRQPARGQGPAAARRGPQRPRPGRKKPFAPAGNKC